MFRFKTCATTAVGGALAGSLLIVEPAHAQSTYEGRVTANGACWCDTCRPLPPPSRASSARDSRSRSSAKCGEAV